MEGICILNYDTNRFARSIKVREYVELIRSRSPGYIGNSSEVQLANIVMSAWAIYYNRPICDDIAFVDSLGFCVEEDVEIINALILMMNISPLNLELYGLTTDEALSYCEEYPATTQLHCKAVSRLYGLMKDSPKMRSGLKKLYRHISVNNDTTLTLDIERFHEEA